MELRWHAPGNLAGEALCSVGTRSDLGAVLASWLVLGLIALRRRSRRTGIERRSR